MSCARSYCHYLMIHASLTFWTDKISKNLYKTWKKNYLFNIYIWPKMRKYFHSMAFFNTFILSTIKLCHKLPLAVKKHFLHITVKILPNPPFQRHFEVLSTVPQMFFCKYMCLFCWSCNQETVHHINKSKMVFSHYSGFLHW